MDAHDTEDFSMPYPAGRGVRTGLSIMALWVGAIVGIWVLVHWLES